MKFWGKKNQDVTIVSPDANERVIGPLPLKISINGAITPKEVYGSINGYNCRGILQLPFCSFLFPPPEDETAEVIITIKTDTNKKIIRKMTFGFKILRDDYVEQSYEMLGPKKTGMVLKRNHIYGSGPPNTIAHQETLDYIVRDSISPVLDIGCGAGVYVSEMNIRHINCQGVEINSEYVDIALKSNLAVSTYDGKTIPFDDSSFNTVMAIEVLEHVEQWENLLMEMLRVAARRVIITTPNIAVLSGMQKHNVVPWHLLEATHVNFFTKEIWRHIILKIENVTGSVFEYSPLLLNGELFNYHLFVLIEKFP
jgi:2-polyprenyl-3-methyl-5-hydroxy-6-metoxy-1,4-benzoquinol methylase